MSMSMFTVVLLVIAIISTLLCVIIGIKNEVTCNCRLRIINAIYTYILDRRDKDEPVEVYYTDMEPYDNTFARWRDWGYTRILPPDKFEIIKPYLDKEKKDGVT